MSIIAHGPFVQMPIQFVIKKIFLSSHLILQNIFFNTCNLYHIYVK